MRTLPSVPGCGQPAGAGLEVYVPGAASGAYGSLAGSEERGCRRMLVAAQEPLPRPRPVLRLAGAR